MEVLAPDGCPTTAAAGLFAALRRLDAAGLDAIVAEPCAEHGLGHAIMDRLRRCGRAGLRPAHSRGRRASRTRSRSQRSISAGSDVKRTATEPLSTTDSTLA